MTAIAVSNLAWRSDEDAAIRRVLRAHDVHCVEIAPGKLWPVPTETPEHEALRRRDEWAAEGFEIVAFQALLFGHPELQLFGDAPSRRAMLDHLARIMAMAGTVGATRLVFGSPGNRRSAGIDPSLRSRIAIDFFRAAGRIAEDAGTVLCIEPNPPAYGCDFVTTAEEGAALVREVDRPGFRLHLDAAAMHLVGDDPAVVIPAAADILAHFHASEPQLGEVGAGAVDHVRTAAALRSAAYEGRISIEMREVPASPSAPRVERAVRAVARQYADVPGVPTAPGPPALR